MALMRQFLNIWFDVHTWDDFLKFLAPLVSFWKSASTQPKYDMSSEPKVEPCPQSLWARFRKVESVGEAEPVDKVNNTLPYIP